VLNWLARGSRRVDETPGSPDSSHCGIAGEIERFFLNSRVAPCRCIPCRCTWVWVLSQEPRRNKADRVPAGGVGSHRFGRAVSRTRRPGTGEEDNSDELRAKLQGEGLLGQSLRDSLAGPEMNKPSPPAVHGPGSRPSDRPPRVAAVHSAARVEKGFPEQATAIRWRDAVSPFVCSWRASGWARDALPGLMPLRSFSLEFRSVKLDDCDESRKDSA
jgi:hypothetical protein